MKPITELLKNTHGSLTDGQREALATLLTPRVDDSYESLTLSAEAKDGATKATYQILTLNGSEDAGQYLISWAAGKSAYPRLVHADTLVFPLPVEVAVRVEVQLALAEQLAGSLAENSDITISKGDLAAHAAALIEGNSDLPLLKSGPQRGLVSWIKGLFQREDPSVAEGTSDGLSSEQEMNDKLVTVAKAQVDILSSREGPDGGNLACVWAVDKIFEKAFGKRLTRTLATAVIDKELADGKGRLIKDEKKVRPGHIIISPTGTGKGHGHIGILGRDGKIYSNSSARARWEQNHTLDSWKKHYVEKKGMALKFYQVLPRAAGVRTIHGEATRASHVPPQPAVSVGASVVADESALESIDRYWAARRAAEPNVRGRGIPLVAEGDSWFDFRITRDVIDWLEKDYNYDIANVAQAGACVYEMAYGDDNDQMGDFFERDPSQLAEVVRLIREKRPRAVLLSGAGNDFVGPEFIMLLHHALAKPTGVNELVAKGLFENEIEPAYRRVIATVKDAARREGLGDIPILVHGYDYAFPDNRPAANLLIKKIGPWMAPSFELKGYPRDLEKRRAHVRGLIDRIYDMHKRIARDFTNVHIVDVRGALPSQGDWHDELHPSREGFQKVARLFHQTLQKVLPRAVSSGRHVGSGEYDLAAVLGEEPTIIPVGDAGEAALPGCVEAPPLRHIPEAESSASLFARAQQAEIRENLMRWLDIDPHRVLRYQETLEIALEDDTRGEGAGSGTRSAAARGVWERIDASVAESLRWAPAHSDALRSATARSAGLTPGLRQEYRNLYDSLLVRPERASAVSWYLSRIERGRDRYESLGTELRIPWEFIAITHSLEASNDFSKHLHNGDPLTARTVRVPAGHPRDLSPPYSFEQSARDAMKLKNYDRQKDWGIEAILFRWEGYNGWGYRAKGIHTPYLWSFSNHYVKGKYTGDHHYDKDAVSKQVGAAVLLHELGYKG